MKKLSCTDLNDEYKVLLLNINKSAGSVTVRKESALRKDHRQYRILPPIKEASFNSSDMDLLRKVVHQHGNLQVLMLHNYSSAAVIQWRDIWVFNIKAKVKLFNYCYGEQTTSSLLYQNDFENLSS